MTEALKLLSLNVKGIRNFKTRRAFFNWCRERANISFLQETHSTVAAETQWRIEWGAEPITCHDSSNSRGVAILIKKGVDCTIHKKFLILWNVKSF